MPVQLGAPMSTYVNQRSAEIAAMLRDRYNRMFAAQSELQQRMNELEVAPFQNDLLHYNNLRNTVMGEIESMAERGDYENMGNRIGQLAQNYNRDATMIARNAEAYNADKAKMQEMLNSGKIAQRDYRYWEIVSKSKRKEDGTYIPYEGVQLDENGYLDANSLYTSTPIANYVDVKDEIIKMIETIDPEIYGGKTTMTTDGVFIYENKDGTVTEVPRDKVEFAVREALNKPEVKDYMYQGQDYNTLQMSAPEMMQMLSRRIVELEASDDPNDIAEAQRLRGIASTAANNPGLLQREMTKILYDQERDQYIKGYTDVYSRRNVRDESHTWEYNDLFLSAARNTGGSSDFTVNPGISSTPIDVNSPYAIEGVITNESLNRFEETVNQTTQTQLNELLGRHDTVLQQLGLKNMLGPGNENLLMNTSVADLQNNLKDYPAVLRDILTYRNSLNQQELSRTNLERYREWEANKSNYTIEDILSNAISDIATHYDVSPENISELNQNLIKENSYVVGAPSPFSGYTRSIQQTEEETILNFAYNLDKDLREGKYGDFGVEAFDSILISLGYSPEEAVRLKESIVGMESPGVPVAYYNKIKPFIDKSIDEAKESRETLRENAGIGRVGFAVFDFPNFGGEDAKTASKELEKMLTGKPLSMIQHLQVVAKDEVATEGSMQNNPVFSSELTNSQIQSVDYTDIILQNQLVPAMKITYKQDKAVHTAVVILDNTISTTPINADGLTIGDALVDNTPGGQALRNAIGQMGGSLQHASQNGVVHTYRFPDGRVMSSIVKAKVANTVDDNDSEISIFEGIEDIRVTMTYPTGERATSVMRADDWVDLINQYE